MLYSLFLNAFALFWFSDVRHVLLFSYNYLYVILVSVYYFSSYKLTLALISIAELKKKLYSMTWPLYGVIMFLYLFVFFDTV